jgi:Ni2+-binding GTPase involved in maturation of urease and hydrogenase
VILSKTDLLPHLPEVRVGGIAEALARVMPAPAFLSVSAETGLGIERWIRRLEEWRAAATREILHAC